MFFVFRSVFLYFTLSAFCSSARSVAEALALWSTRLVRSLSPEESVSILRKERKGQES